MSKADEEKLISRAVKELGIDVPVMTTRLVGNQLELHLYGGEVKVWTVEGVQGGGRVSSALESGSHASGLQKARKGHASGVQKARKGKVK